MKASLRRVLKPRETRGNDWVQEWDDVEVVERLESLEARVESLLAERDHLQAELSALTAGDEIEEARVRPLQGRHREILVWWKLSLLTVLVLAPWAVIGSIVWLLAS
jgi:hypothetical protein